MDKNLNLFAKASVTIHASVEEVWEALTNPEIIKKYMMGTEVISDWQEGSSIIWRGEWEGKAYEDKGEILQIEPGRLLQYNHFSPLSGLEDIPENYHTVSIELSDDQDGVEVALTQDKNPTEQVRKHVEQNWKMMLNGLKKVVES